MKICQNNFFMFNGGEWLAEGVETNLSCKHNTAVSDTHSPALLAALWFVLNSNKAAFKTRINISMLILYKTLPCIVITPILLT